MKCCVVLLLSESVVMSSVRDDVLCSPKLILSVGIIFSYWDIGVAHSRLGGEQMFTSVRGTGYWV